jgi:hypothetical protein
LIIAVAVGFRERRASEIILYLKEEFWAFRALS